MNKPQRRAFLHAAREGRVDSIGQLLAEGVPVDVCDEDGQTPLSEAAWNGHAEAVRVLLAAGADPRRDHSRALDFAVRAGTPECVELLLKAGADPNAVDSGDHEETDEDVDEEAAAANESLAMVTFRDPTMLMEAIGRGDSRTIELLLEAGADIRALNGVNGMVAWAISARRDNWVPRLIEAGAPLDGCLIAAVHTKQPELLDRLLALGMPADDLHPEHETPLMAAVTANHADLVRRLIQAGADVNRTSRHESTPLETAVMFGHDEIARILLEAGATDRADSDSLLVEAIVRETPAGVKALLNHGVDPNEAKGGSPPPLFYAIGQRSARIVSLLLAAGANANAPIADGKSSPKTNQQAWLTVGGKRLPPGMTPLMFAAHKGSAKIVQALLDAGADPRAVDRHQRAAIDFASAKGHTAIVKMLEGLGPSSSVEGSRMHGQALLRAIVANDAPAAAAALAAGGDPNTTDNYGTCALSHAAKQGMTELVRQLLAAGARPDHTGAPHGIPALRHAALRANAEIVGLLLDAGADCKPQWTPGSVPANKANTVFLSYATPLHDSAAYGHRDNIDLLLAAGADINAADERNLTPVLAAVNHRQMQTVEHLLAAGAVVRKEDEPWMAPYHFARAAQTPEFQQLKNDITAVVGSAPMDVAPLPGVLCWTIRLTGQPEPPQNPLESVESGRQWGKQFAAEMQGLDELSNQVQDRLHKQVALAGCLFVDAGMPVGCGPMVRHMALLPTRDKFAAMIAFGVRGNDQELSTKDIVAWFRALDEERPFHLRGIRFDTVAIEFLEPVPDPHGMAARMCAFCHDLGSAEAVAERLQSTRRVDFWWD